MNRSHSTPRRGARRGVAIEMIIVVAAMAALIAAVIGGLIGAAIASQQQQNAGPGTGSPTAPTTGTFDPMDLYTRIQADLDTQRDAYDAIDTAALDEARLAVEDAVENGEDPGEALTAYGDAYDAVRSQWDAILGELDRIENGDLVQLEDLDPTLAQGLREYLDTLRGSIEADMELFPAPEDLGIEACEGDECSGEEPAEEEDEPETVEEGATTWEVVVTYERLETGVDVITACENFEEPMPGESGYEAEKEAFLEAHLTSSYEFTSFTYTSAEPITAREGELLLEFAERVLQSGTQDDDGDEEIALELADEGDEGDQGDEADEAGEGDDGEEVDES